MRDERFGLASGADAVPRPLRARDNLPAPTYSGFIMRPDAYAQVVEGLGQRSALIVVVNMGGMGKSSLALEVAKRCVGQDAGQPPDPVAPSAFDAAVWLSDHDRPGATPLVGVLDTVALTDGVGLRAILFE